MKSSSTQAASEAAINTPPDDAGPCIILVGSFRSQQSDKNQEGYASTKAGEIGLMHSMAISLSNLGIRVNMISPGMRARMERKMVSRGKMLSRRRMWRSILLIDLGGRRILLELRIIWFMQAL
jgi:NAD(P)-dependent dehydrogenase (short-subunit alcohol dehydrogenase family)